jgi:hypothetical protein
MSENKNPDVVKRQQMMADLSNMYSDEETKKKETKQQNNIEQEPTNYMESVQPTPDYEEDNRKNNISAEEVPQISDGISSFEDMITDGLNNPEQIDNYEIGKEPVEEPKPVKHEKKNTKLHNSNEDPVENEIIGYPEPPIEEKPHVTKKKSTPKKVDIVTPEEAELIENKEKKTKVTNIKNKIDDFSDLDEQVEISNKERFENSERGTKVKDLTEDEFIKTMDEIYSDDSTIDVPKSDVKVEIVEDSHETEEKPKAKGKKKERTINYYGGDGEVTAFKTKISKNAKILRNISIEDTSTISSSSINVKNAQERQDVYLKTVLPTLQPSIIAVPMIISGVVVSMSAFTWPDIKEICLIEEKLNDLDVESPDYIYEKNKNFIEKRKKQLQLFYKHITAVSGYESRPSYDELFNKILKFPDFQQLFFAAYATTSQSKAHQFNIACGACGSDNYVSVKPKDLCFLLNTNVNLNNLIYYIEKGSSMDNSESAKVYQEFQKEKIVEMANTTYRTKQPLPNSQFIYDLKIPTIGEALSAMEDIIEVFRDKDLSHTEEYTGNTVYIDSSFGLTPDLIELRYYLYLHKLIVARVIEENKENNSAKVSYVDFDDRQAIYNSIYNLSPEDYKTLITDDTLGKLVRVSGIRHAIKGGKCSEPSCKEELGNVSVEPEALFFTIAQREVIF